MDPEDKFIWLMLTALLHRLGDDIASCNGQKDENYRYTMIDDDYLDAAEVFVAKAVERAQRGVDEDVPADQSQG